MPGLLYFIVLLMGKRMLINYLRLRAALPVRTALLLRASKKRFITEAAMQVAVIAVRSIIRIVPINII